MGFFYVKYLSLYYNKKKYFRKINVFFVFSIFFLIFIIIKQLKTAEWQIYQTKINMANQKQTEAEIIAEAINYLAEAVDNSEMHGPNKQCGIIGSSLTENVWLLAHNIGRIADVMEKQSKQN